MRTRVICVDGKAAVDLDSSTRASEHRSIHRWFQTAHPHDVLTVRAPNVTTILQRQHIVRIEVTE